MFKCQSCDEQFEKEEELKKHQNDNSLCFSCCHKLCVDCVKPIENGVRVIQCCQCGRTNY